MGAWLEKHARTLLIIVGGLMVLAGASWWIFFYQARLTLVPTPVSATVTIDGATVAAGTRIKLEPGPHVITASLNDFIPFSQTVQAKSGQYLPLPIILRAVPHLQKATLDQVTGVALEPTTNAISVTNRTTKPLPICDMAQIKAHDAPWETIEKLKPRGVILSGGPASIYEHGAPTIPAWG